MQWKLCVSPYHYFWREEVDAMTIYGGQGTVKSGRLENESVVKSYYKYISCKQINNMKWPTHRIMNETYIFKE